MPDFRTGISFADNNGGVVIMSKTWAVCKNELLRYFISPLAYVYLVAFLLLNGSFAVYFGYFIGRGTADLSSMFAFQPWLYLLFIPAVSMRLWAEEFKSKTIIQIMTMPVAISNLVWGKFFASWIFTAIALLLTFPFVITVNYMGSPDNGVILLSYFASWILAGCMLAISQMMSAMTKNQVIALVLAVIANFLFFLSGVEYVLGFFRLFASANIVDMIASFSFITHFNTLTQGLLELRDVVFFASIIFLFNFITVLVVSFKTSGTSRWLKSTQAGYYVLVFVLLLLGFGGLNLLANNFLRSQQYDFTEEKFYTLSVSSQKVLQDIEEPVIAKLYYSPILGERNSSIRLMYDRVRTLLQRLEKQAPEKFSFKIYNPEPLDDIEDQAIAAGLQPLPLVDFNQNAFFGLVLTDSTDKKQVMPFFAMERQGYLEQDVIESIYQLYHPKKTLGIISTLPVFDTQQASGYVSAKWNIINEIERFYDVLSITSPDDLDKIDVLMMIHPQELSDDYVQAIKKYSLRGGKTLLLLDAAAESSRIFSAKNTEFYPSSLGGLDDFWGFRFYNEIVVADLDNSITVDATKNYSTNPIFTQDVIQFVLPSSSMNPDFEITKNLQSVLFASASVVMPNGNSLFLPLITGGDNSGVMASGVVYEGKTPPELLRMFKPNKQLKFIAALLVQKNSYNPFEVVVVTDSDFIYDSFWSVGRTILEKNYFIPLYDNGNFILNSLDYLSGDKTLIALRGRTAKIRNFEDMESLRKANLREFHLRENAIFAKIDLVKKALDEVVKKKNFEERESFNADELAVIARTRQQLDNLRGELASLRKKIHYNLEQMDFYLKLINIYTVPLVILTGLLLFSFTKSRNKNIGLLKIGANKEIVKIGLFSLFLLAAGGMSIYFNSNNDISNYENKPLFPELVNQLPEIVEIRLQSNAGEIDFYFENGLWKAKGHPCMVVYQERIKHLLSSIVGATYYEKKSDKLEYLVKFGLEPIEKEGSPNTLLALKNAEGKEIVAFNIGRYDIDLGRGARAAYVKLDNSFQVWMAKFDLIDISSNINDWSYSTLWNLRWGRLSGYNNVENLNRVVELVKNMLNTSFVSATQELENAKKQTTLSLKAEDFSKVDIDFLAKDNDIYVHYSFKNMREKSYMEFFAQTADKCYYQISQSAFEKVKNVIQSAK